MTSVRSVRFRGITALPACLVALALVAACTASSGTGPNPSGTYSQPSYTTAGPSSTAVAQTTTSTSTNKSPTSRTTTGSSTTKTASTRPAPSIFDRNTRRGEKPPTLLAIGRMHTSPGAIAYSLYWVKTLDWAQATMDTSLATHAAGQSCPNCVYFINHAFSHLIALHQFYRGGRVDLKSTTIEKYATTGTDLIYVALAQEPASVVNSSGRLVSQLPGSASFTSYVRLAWTSSGWALKDWGRVIVK